MLELRGMEFVSRKVEYPESDGEPMTDKDVNRFAMMDTEFVLREHFRAAPDVYVSSNLFLYYTEGEPDDRVAPDVFVVHGVGKQDRDRYLLWEEGQPPSVVFEFTSRSTRMRDRGEKLGIYAALGVREYYLFDPTGEWMSPAFRCFRLKGELFEELVAPGGIHSPALGLDLVVDQKCLRFRLPGQDSFLATPQEMVRRAEAETRRAEAETRRAEAETRRAESEARRAEAEARRAEALAAKLRALGVDPDEP